MGLLEELQNNNREYSKLTVDKLKDIINTLNSVPKKQPTITYYGDAEGVEYFNAVLSDDQDTIKRINADRTARWDKTMKALYENVANRWGQSISDMLKELISRYRYKGYLHPLFDTITFVLDSNYDEDLGEYTEDIIVFDNVLGLFLNMVRVSDEYTGRYISVDYKGQIEIQ